MDRLLVRLLVRASPLWVATFPVWWVAMLYCRGSAPPVATAPRGVWEFYQGEIYQRFHCTDLKLFLGMATLQYVALFNQCH